MLSEPVFQRAVEWDGDTAQYAPSCHCSESVTMSRPLRIEISGGIYHVTARGNGRLPIFKSDSDRMLLLGTLGEVVERCGWLCHAYCLMGNHYHLLLETPEPNLSKGMHQLNGSYAHRFNRLHQQAGHVLQGRFHALLVERDAHLLELCRYLVLNPVRAGLVGNAGQYRWSSYRATMGYHTAEKWLHVDWVLAQFGAHREQARVAYRSFVDAGVGLDSPLQNTRGQVFVGSLDFIQDIEFLIEQKRQSAEIPLAQRVAARPALDAIFDKSLPGDKTTRDRLICDAYQIHQYSQVEIGRHLGVHYSTISRILRRRR